MKKENKKKKQKKGSRGKKNSVQELLGMLRTLFRPWFWLVC